MKNSLNTILTTVVLLLSIFAFMATVDLNHVFNSDQVNIAYLIKDLFQHHGKLADWTLSNTNYLFPDTVIYFFYYLFDSNVRIVTLLTDCTLLVLYYLAMVVLGALVCDKENKNIFRISALLSLILATGSLRSQEIFMPLLVSHFGSNVICYLFMLYFLVAYLIYKNVIYFYLGLILVFLAVLSDPLTIAIMLGSSFMASIGLYRFVDWKEKLILRKIMLYLIVVTILSILTFKLHLFHLYIGHAPTQFVFGKQSILSLYHLFLIYFKNNPVIILLVLIYLVITAVLFFRLLFAKTKPYFFARLGMGALFVLFATGSCIAILIVCSVLFDKDLIPIGIGLRHFNAAILIPVFLGVPILLVKYTRISLINRYYFYFIIALLIYSLVFIKDKSLNSFINYYPQITQCLDTYYQNGQLKAKNGISDYWDAHSNAILSKNDLNIVAISADYRPYDWMATKNDYLDKLFYFVLLHKNDMDRQRHLVSLGHPDTVLTCRGDSSFLIYVFDKGFSLRYSEF